MIGLKDARGRENKVYGEKYKRRKKKKEEEERGRKKKEERRTKKNKEERYRLTPVHGFQNCTNIHQTC